MSESIRILVSDKLAAEGIEILKRHPGIEVDVDTGLSPEVLRERIGAYDGLIIRSGTQVDAPLLQAADKLKAVGRAGIGVDNVDLKAASVRGVLVMNTPDGNVITTAEHAISLMTSLIRKIPQATASMKAGRWEKSKFSGRELTHKTLGIVGLGNIGKIVAKRAQGLQMKVICYDPYITAERARSLDVEKVELDALMKRADVISLHVPLFDSTKNIINAERLAMMKPGGYLVNAARGGLVDEAAVIAALDSGQLAGAAFDVYTKEPPPEGDPLIAHPAVICTPHLGASTSEAQVNVAVAVAEQMIAYLTAQTIANAVNAPKVGAELRGVLGPFQSLAEKLGRLAGQLHPEGAQKVELRVESSDEFPLAPVTASALVGLFEVISNHPVNPVSAPYLAKDRGIEVVESRVNRQRGFSRALRLTLVGPTQSTEVLGALFSDDVFRVVRVNRRHLEIRPEGSILLIEHEDQPGAVGRLGTVLGAAEVNISRMTLSAAPADGAPALAALSVDHAPGEAVVKELEALPGIHSVREVDLG